MSITQNTLIGRTRQSIGGATFSTWKGLNVLKSKPITVANPRTAAQIAQRGKLAAAVLLYRLASFLFDVGFKELAIHMSAYNAFVSTNIRNEAISSDPNQPIDAPANFQTGKGSLYPVPITTAVADNSANTVTITYPATVIADQLGSDFAYAAAYTATGTFLGASDGADTRTDAGLNFTTVGMPAAGQTIWVYLFFAQASSGKVSDSDNISTVVVA